MEENEELIARRWMVREEELDDEQYKVKMMKMDNYLIDGCAGSGKTILALQKAKEIQDSNLGSYLVIIYTLTLQSFIKDGVTSLGLDPERVCNFDSLAKKGYESADYIIVDEIQDFPIDKIEKMKKMAKKNFIFFGDDAQQVYGNKNNNISLNEIREFANIEESNYRLLEKNYRLPKPIAEFAKQINLNSGNLADRCVKNTGDKPTIIKHTNPQKQLDYIVNLINNETLQDTGILVGTNEEVNFIKNYFEKIGQKAEYKYYYLKKGDLFKRPFSNLDFYTSSPKVMTYHSSKGLQFEQVFLPLCEHEYQDNNFKEAMYVAATRTSERLIITYSNVLSPHIKSVDSSLSEHYIN